MIHGGTRLGARSNIPSIQLKPPFLCIYLILKQHHLSLNINRAQGSVFTVSPLGIQELFLATAHSITRQIVFPLLGLERAVFRL